MAAKPDHEAPGLSGTPQQERVDRPGGRWRLPGAIRRALLPEPLGGPGRAISFAVTVIRYADGGRVVLEFGEEPELSKLFEIAIGRCSDYGWLGGELGGELGKGSEP